MTINFLAPPAAGRTRYLSLLLFALVYLPFISCSAGYAQVITARITVVHAGQQARVKVEGAFPAGSAVWSFRNTYGRVNGLGERIQNLSLADATGGEIPVRNIAPGEFKSEKATRFAYEVSLSRLPNPADASHISALNDQFGYLMLADLLPLLPANVARVAVEGPPGWSVRSSLLPGRDGFYELPDPANGVFFVARDLKEKRRQLGTTEFVFVTAGQWSFAPDAVTKIATKIIEDHSRHTGLQPKGRVVLMLAPFPGSFGPERWSAGTRGSNLVLLMGPNARAKALLGQLSVVLCHELFHVWVPNALSLQGNYDWFFEGFTLYQALRCAQRLGFIDFQEYLDTIGRVYDSYRAASERDHLSLIEISRRRWTSGSSLVYDKGMLVAFLFDLQSRHSSGGRRSLDDLYVDLFRHFPLGSEAKDGNESVVSALEDQQFAGGFITGASTIELETLLPSYGLRARSFGSRMQLQVAETLTASQRALLESLGYRKR